MRSWHLTLWLCLVARHVGAVCICENSCLFAFDRHCDDGGSGHQDRSCKLGTDCADCGPRCSAQMPSTRAPVALLRKGKWRSGHKGQMHTFAQEKAWFDQQAGLKKRAVATRRCDLRCPGGRFRNQAHGGCRCSACPAGWFRVDDKMRLPCVKCPAGKFAGVRLAATGASKCALCPRGKMSFHYRDTLGRPIAPTAVGTFRCTACAPGSFKSAVGASTCTECSEGQYTATAAQHRCAHCQPGTLQQFRGRRKCAKCLSGQWNNIPVARHCVRCRACPHGQYRYGCGSTTSGMCLNCQLGRAKPRIGIWSTPCLKCAPGRFQSLEAAQSCRRCTSGRFTSYSGSDTCGPCKACAAGSFRSRCGTASAGDCTACPAGKFSGTASADACVPCSAGMYSARVGALRCIPCPAGKFQAHAGRHFCAACTACASGLFRNRCGMHFGGVCRRCPPGKFSRKGRRRASPCAVCPSGRFAVDVGATACKVCLRGRMSLPSGMACAVSCPADTHVVRNIWDQATGCALCPAGRHAAVGAHPAHPCIACPPGAFSHAGAKQCTPCSQRVCPAGMFSVGCGYNGEPGSCALPEKNPLTASPTPVKYANSGASKPTLAGACCDPMWHATATITCMSGTGGKLHVVYLPPYTFAEIKQHSCRVVPGGSCRCCRCDTL
jgi:hypothetical protein